MPPISNHRIEYIMGTAISLEAGYSAVPESASDDAFSWLREVDDRFSPFKPDSEVSRLLRGEIDESACSLDLRRILSYADALADRTGGYFDIRGHRPDGRPDPTGLVKGWALEEAAWLLGSAGVKDFCLNGGGDVVTRGGPTLGAPWLVGIRHPEIADALVGVLRLAGQSVATSGAYERGDHIIDPHRREPAHELQSVSIIGPSLSTADGLATAVFAMGRAGVDWLADMTDYGVFAVTAQGEALCDDQAALLLSAGGPH